MENKVEIIGWYGGDMAIARAAWTSTSTEVEKKTDDQIRDLIVNKLWKNSTGKPHRTPFERGIVEWNVTCDIASHIHMIKHRHANVNGESARYKELKEDKYYLPEDWRDIKSSSHSFFAEPCNGMKPTTDLGAYHYEKWIDILQHYTEHGNKLYHDCLKDLTPILGRKRAKESARFFKTYNSQTTLSVMMNMSCFENFRNLRVSDEAQLEIREIGAKMTESIKQIPGNPFKHTIEAFGL